MNKVEKITVKVLEMWSEGEESVLASWREHAVADLVWWNSARGAVDGLEPCLAGISAMFKLMDVTHVEVPIKMIMSDGDTVVVERSDDLRRADGSLVASVPVIGVVRYKDDKIVEWRDYCDDWMTKRGYKFD